MKNKVQKIVEQIKDLVDELAAISGRSVTKKQIIIKRKTTSTPKGAIGALTMLTEEGFFDTPKDISAIMKKLREIGRYYPQTTVSMNLLNLSRRRIFNRFQDKDTKKWLYVLRK